MEKKAKKVLWTNLQDFAFNGAVKQATKLSLKVL
jgi:hypothetical protein